MDDLIVIILTLAVAGISVIGQFKKKKQQTPKTDSSAAPTSFWDLVQDEPEFPQQETGLEYNNQDFEEEMQTEHKNIAVKQEKTGYQFNSKREDRSDIMDKKVLEIKTKKHKNKLIKDFSLQKAVIYSEILNRKYT